MALSIVMTNDDINTAWIEETLRLMREQGLTQEQLANKLSITPGAFNHWMTGRRKPKYEDIIKISELLGVPLTYLTSPNDTDVALTAKERKLIADIRGLHDKAALTAKELKLVKDIRALNDESQKVILKMVHLLSKSNHK
ncbi:MAG TPA: XRE family transcriptional regulator [Methylococcaceae bacterium]|jgi:transcriptional regulator with XRE-family HTH domain|nr:XRE family transcriptional regulator [Methylococcaceae bacterium]